MCVDRRRDIDHYSHEYGGAMPFSQFFDGGQVLHGSVLTRASCGG